MTMTGEIRTVREGWLVRASIAEMSDIYYPGDEARRATLEEQLLLDRERRAARQELDRIRSMSTLYRGL